MSGERTPPRLGRWLVGALVLVAAVLVALSPTFGRATPSGAYRPLLPPDALTNGCYPLPDGVRLDFPYQVRHDGDVNGRRNLVIQYDLIDRDAAVAALTKSFAAAGFRTPVDDGVASTDGDTSAREVVLQKGTTRVIARVVPMDPLTKDQIVRGTITLDLPSEQVRSSAAVCSDVTSTKRFPSDQESHDVGVPGGIN